jgi:ribonuclease Z
VKKLLIGHFSARYDDLQPLLEEAVSVFPNTIIAGDGMTINI